MVLECVLFDCDGVLLDSVPAKTRAFALLVAEYGPEAQKRFVQFHEQHGGVNRYKKFAWFFENVLGRPITPQESKKFGERFVAISQQELLNCALIKGAENTLKSLQGKLPLFVASGAPQAEQQAILAAHNLAQYFDGIYGAPPGKADLLRQILDQHHIQPQNAIMVGDAFTDLQAANEVGTKFYGVGPLLAGGNYPWAEDLSSFATYITSQF